MKNILFFLCFIFIGASFAQNEQNANAVYKDENGNLYKLTPVTEDGATQNTSNGPNNQIAATQDNAYAADSIAIYQERIDQYNASGKKTRTIGTAFFWASFPLFISGTVLYFSGLSDCDDDYCSSTDNPSLFVGDILMGVGIASFVTGIVLKRVGANKLDRATQNEQKLQIYKARHGIASVRLVPNYNVATKQASLNLALGF